MASFLVTCRHTAVLCKEERERVHAFPRPPVPKPGRKVFVRRRAGEPDVRRTMAALGHRWVTVVKTVAE